MTVKLLLLKSGEDVIADVTEMGSGDKDDRRVVGYFPVSYTHLTLPTKA